MAYLFCRPEAMADLIYLMNTLVDKDGKILIDGIDKNVRLVHLFFWTLQFFLFLFLGGTFTPQRTRDLQRYRL